MTRWIYITRAANTRSIAWRGIDWRLGHFFSYLAQQHSVAVSALCFRPPVHIKFLISPYSLSAACMQHSEFIFLAWNPMREMSLANHVHARNMHNLFSFLLHVYFQENMQTATCKKVGSFFFSFILISFLCCPSVFSFFLLLVFPWIIFLACILFFSPLLFYFSFLFSNIFIFYLSFYFIVYFLFFKDRW